MDGNEGKVNPNRGKETVQQREGKGCRVPLVQL